MVWRLLPTLSAPMPLQMALDELLFAAQKKDLQAPILRFYFSSAPWISVGYSFRNEADRAQSELITKYPGVPVCRRITGGGCVLHGQDLIFSLIARYAERGSPSHALPGTVPLLRKGPGSQSPLGSVRTSYAKIHEAVTIGLRSFDVAPRSYTCRDELPKGSDCFEFPVESDLSWKGKKIAGGAQKRSEGVLLHHESIAVPRGIRRDDLIRAVCGGVEQVFGVKLENADLDPEVYFNAERLTTND